MQIPADPTSDQTDLSFKSAVADSIQTSANMSPDVLTPAAVTVARRAGQLPAQLSKRELKAGMIRILGAATAATYLALIRKDAVMRQEMTRLVVAHSIL